MPNTKDTIRLQIIPKELPWACITRNSTLANRIELRKLFLLLHYLVIKVFIVYLDAFNLSHQFYLRFNSILLALISAGIVCELNGGSYHCLKHDQRFWLTRRCHWMDTFIIDVIVFVVVWLWYVNIRFSRLKLKDGGKQCRWLVNLFDA